RRRQHEERVADRDDRGVAVVLAGAVVREQRRVVGAGRHAGHQHRRARVVVAGLLDRRREDPQEREDRDHGRQVDEEPGNRGARGRPPHRTTGWGRTSCNSSTTRPPTPANSRNDWAAPAPIRKNWKPTWTMCMLTGSVATPGPPPVRMKGRSNIFSRSMSRTTSTAAMVVRRSGRVTWRKAWRPEAPSTRAASYSSSGITLSPARRKSMTKLDFCQTSTRTTE